MQHWGEHVSLIQYLVLGGPGFFGSLRLYSSGIAGQYECELGLWRRSNSMSSSRSPSADCDRCSSGPELQSWISEKGSALCWMAKDISYMTQWSLTSFWTPTTCPSPSWLLCVAKSCPFLWNRFCVRTLGTRAETLTYGNHWNSVNGDTDAVWESCSCLACRAYCEWCSNVVPFSLPFCCASLAASFSLLEFESLRNPSCSLFNPILLLQVGGYKLESKASVRTSTPLTDKPSLQTWISTFRILSSGTFHFHTDNDVVFLKLRLCSFETICSQGCLFEIKEIIALTIRSIGSPCFWESKLSKSNCWDISINILG